MHRLAISVLVATMMLPAGAALAAPWPAPRSPVVRGADGYIAIPNAAVAPTRAHVYRAIYNATLAAAKPTELLPAVNMAGSELNALGVAGVPLTNAQFVLVFHDAGLDGILDDAHYRAKFGVANPNLAALAETRKAGVKLFVCGQNLAFAHVDPAAISPDVRVASDALIVLMTYQNQGYALLSY